MLKVVEKILASITVCLLLLMTGVVSIQIISRIANSTVVWTEELTRLTLVYLTFLGAAYSYFKGDGLKITMLTDRFPKNWRKINDLIINFISLVALAIITFLGMKFAIAIWDTETIALEWNRGLLLLVLPVGILLIAIKTLRSIIESFVKWGES